MNQFDLWLDLDKSTNPRQVVRIRQGDEDGTTIAAAIYDHGMAVTDAPDACHITMRLPDGTHYYRKAATWADGTATVTIDETQAASAVGRTALAYFQLTYGTDLLSTGAFTVTVEPDAVGDAELPEDYDTAIQDAIDRCNAAAAAIESALPIGTANLANGAVTSAKLADVVRKGDVRSFDTVAAMQAATDLLAGMTCHTNGFHASGDGGAAYYTVSTSGTANGMDVLALQGGLKAHQVVQEFGNKVGTTGDFAREMVSNVAMSYVLRRDEFIYDDEHDLFHGDGAQVGGKYQICCSAFVMAVINGIPFESSKYNGGTNEINGFGFCDSSLIEFYENDTDQPEEYWKFSHHLAKYLNEHGYCYVPEPDLSNVQTGDVLFLSLEGSGTDPTSGYMGINHSSIFRDVYNDNMYSVWEVGTIPTLAQYPLTYLENNPVVLACRPPYKDFDKPTKIKNAVRYSSFSTATNVPIVGVGGFKRGQCYTVDFDVSYDYDEAQGQTYHYPAVIQTDGTTLFNAYGGTEIKNHYTLFVTPTDDVADLIVQTRAVQTGLSNAGTLSNLLVVEGFHPQMAYVQPDTNAIFTAASGYTVNSRKYNMGEFVALYLDAKNIAPNSAQVIGSVTSTITPMPIIPCPAIAVTASGTFPAAAWVRNDGAVCCKYTGNSNTITDMYISILLPTELKAQS